MYMCIYIYMYKHQVCLCMCACVCSNATYLPVSKSAYLHLSIQVSSCIHLPISPSIYPSICPIIPFGKHNKNYGQSPFLMGKQTLF